MTNDSRPLVFGVFEFEPASGELRRNGRTVRIAPQPAQVLERLLTHPGQVVSRDDLKKLLWRDDTFVDFDQGLNFCIRQAREALGDDADRPRYIETLPRRGYRFVAAVSRPVEIAETPAPPATVTAPPAQPIGMQKIDRSGRSVFAIAALLVVVVAASIYAGFVRDRQTPGRGQAMVAVLPFENLSGDPGQQYFSDGVTDELTLRLGRAAPGSLGVIARTSMAAYRGSGKSARQIGLELGVEHIVEGTVRRAGDHVRITAELVPVRDQSPVWSETYDADLRDVLAVQEEIGYAIARRVTEHLRIAGGARPHRIDPAVYDLYLKGRQAWNHRTPDDVVKAIGAFEEATQRDPDFAQAFAGLGDGLNSTGAVRRGYEAAERALALDDQLAEAHATRALALMHMLRWDDAGRAFARAVQLDPSYSPGLYMYADYLVTRGRRTEALDHARRALVVDPLSAIAHHAAGVVAYYAGDYEAALPDLLKALELGPAHAPSHGRIAMVYERRSDWPAAISEWSQAKRPSRAAYALAKAGHVEEARRIVAGVLAQPDTERDNYDLAAAYVGLGEYDRALGALATAIRMQNYDVVYLDVDPRLEPLRSRPGFSALTRELAIGSR